MRAPLGILVCLLLMPGPAAADDKKPAERKPLTAEQAAGRVLDAVAAKNARALRGLAEQDEPDPWLVADVLCSRGEYDAAEAFANAAPRVDVEKLAAFAASRRGKPPDEAERRVLSEMGAALEARQFHKAVDTARSVKGPLDSVLRVRIAHARGLALRDLRRPRASARGLTRVGEAARALGWLSRAAWAFNDAGLSSYFDFDYRGARSAMTARLEIERLRDNPQGIARGHYNVALAEQRLGRLPEALRHYEKALALGREIDDTRLVSLALNNVGSAQATLGNYPEALRHYHESLRISRAQGDQAGVARTVSAVGLVHVELGDHEEALRHFEQSLAIHRKTGDQAGIAAAYTHTGNVHHFLGNYPAALRHYGDALAIQRKLGRRRSVAGLIQSIGLAHSLEGDLTKAVEHLDEALRIERELDNKRGIARTLATLGEVRLRMGRYVQAAGALHEARDLMEYIPRQGQARVLWGLADLHLRQGQLETAIEHARAGVEHVSDFSQRLAEGEGAGARDAFAGLFDVAYRSALRAARSRDLLWFLEHGRAGSLREGLGSGGALEAALLPADLRDALAVARTDELRALTAYRRSRHGGNFGGVREARKAWDAARADVARVAARIQREAKAAASVVLPAPDDVETIRTRLLPGEALVLFCLTTEEALALVLRKDGARAVPLPASREIEAAVEALLDGDRQVVPGRARALRKLLIDPLALKQEVTRVLVSPAGRLAYVPFALLLPDRDIAYMPSGTTHGVLLEERAKRGRKILGLGDPDYKSVVDRAALKVRGGDLTRLSALPATRKEVSAVADVRILSKAATEAGLREALEQQKRWRSVHLACHGLVDPERPLLSALALTADKGNDGFLTCLDVFRMKIPADLVVLSACDTGKGKIYKTEGIVGLTRAFMYAGAPRVICSLWKVDDEATQALMIKFYELWNPKEGKGLGAAAALKQAQAFIRSHAKWKHPYYWAAWVLWGLP